MYMFTHVLMRDEKEGRRKEASMVKQTNKAKQHSTPKAVTFPKKNELPRVGLEPTTLYTLDRALYQLYMYLQLQVYTCIYFPHTSPLRTLVYIHVHVGTPSGDVDSCARQQAHTYIHVCLYKISNRSACASIHYTRTCTMYI